MADSERKPTTTAEDWQRRYELEETPWDSGRVEVELRRLIESGELIADANGSGRAIELGCGTGTNVVYLAEQGFTTTGIDFAPPAIARAATRASQATFTPPLRAPTFLTADVTKLDAVAKPDGVTGPFDFLFDRGCYHCIRRAGQLSGYLATVRRLMPAGSRLLILAGNPDAGEVGGPPKVTAAELAGDFEKICRIDRLVARRFEESDGSSGPLGWSLLMTRR
ncbi:MAG: methyltransferase domain-containing protein [Planctomycetia bacterium]|nr:methyltransferase domain-containing protein [Planctomycetia bacterium]